LIQAKHLRYYFLRDGGGSSQSEPRRHDSRRDGYRDRDQDDLARGAPVGSFSKQGGTNLKEKLKGVETYGEG